MEPCNNCGTMNGSLAANCRECGTDFPRFGILARLIEKKKQTVILIDGEKKQEFTFLPPSKNEHEKAILINGLLYISNGNWLDEKRVYVRTLYATCDIGE